MNELILHFLAIVLIIGFILTILGVPAETSLFIGFCVAMTVFFAAIIYAIASIFYERYYIKGVVAQNKELVTKLLSHKMEYDKAHQILQEELPNGSSYEIYKAAEKLGLPFLKGTLFYRYYGEFYTSIDGLCILYAFKNAYDSTGLRISGLDEAYTRIAKGLTEDHEILSKHPWLLPPRLY